MASPSRRALPAVHMVADHAIDFVACLEEGRPDAVAVNRAEFIAGFQRLIAVQRGLRTEDGGRGGRGEKRQRP